MDKKLSHYLKNANFRQKRRQHTDTSAVSTQTNHTDILKIKDGKIVLDDTATYGDFKNYSSYDVSEDSHGIVTSSSFKKSRGKTHWTEEDNQLFYDALNVCGIEFTLISELFPHKTRKQIKRKFLKEERLNKHRIDDVLSQTIDFDRDAYNELMSRSK